MTRLKGITPTPDQAAQAHSEVFGPVIDEAGGKDSRISKASAQKVGERPDAGVLVADNLLNYLDATGQKTVGSAKFKRILGDYVERHVQNEAGSNQKLSLVETANLPKDLKDDIFFLRGKTSHAPLLPRVSFNEAAIHDFTHEWKPQHVIASGQIRYQNNTLLGVDLPEQTPVHLQPIAENVLTQMWDFSFHLQTFGGVPFALGATHGQGDLRFGEILNANDGKPYLLVNWRDIDDNSFAWLFEKQDDGVFEEKSKLALG